MSVHDLDALASEPLTIRHSGKEYRVDVTVATMIKFDRARQSGSDTDQWELIKTIMGEAGMPPEVFEKLNVRQATSLAERITRHFFPEAVAEVGAKAESPLSGPTPSEPSSATSAETPQQ